MGSNEWCASNLKSHVDCEDGDAAWSKVDANRNRPEHPYPRLPLDQLVQLLDRVAVQGIELQHLRK